VSDLVTYTLASLRRWNVTHGSILQEPTERYEGLGDMILVDLRTPGQERGNPGNHPSHANPFTPLTVGRYYFTGVWGQAEQGVPGQQTVRRVLAPHPAGLTLPELAAAAGLEEVAAHAALETLARHDVVVQQEARWRFTVELMRRWVTALPSPNPTRAHE